MIRVITPTYNACNHTRICLDSLKNQTIDFAAYIIDDASTDNTHQVITESVGDDHRFKCTRNGGNLKSLHNIAMALNNMSAEADGEDIICILDGDDYLVSNTALATITEAYERTGCEALYGEYITCDGETIRTTPVPQILRETGDYRREGWCYNPIRTFKYKIWRHIDQERYLKNGGAYFPDTGDQALFYCILELTGGNAYYLEGPLYKVGAMGRSDGESQDLYRRHIIALPPNKRVLDWDSVSAPTATPGRVIPQQHIIRNRTFNRKTS